VGGVRGLDGSGVVLRTPEPGDEPAYAKLLRAPEVAAWLRPLPLPPITDGEIAEMVADDMRQWRDGGFGPWVLASTADGGGAGDLVGRVGLRRTAIGGRLRIELAWTVLPDWWGRGLASAAGLESVALARSLELDEVVALVLPANTASRRVAAKVGMVEAGEVIHAGLPHLLYRLAL
jgi:[ribosomal protein S5]-alanine N-acetyltransferase